VGLAVFCPVTGQAKGYPFETALPSGLPVQGVVLADHVRSLDWRTRRAEFIGATPAEVVEDVAGAVVSLADLASRNRVPLAIEVALTLRPTGRSKPAGVTKALLPVPMEWAVWLCPTKPPPPTPFR
jgi:mRNA interferase MazF